MYCLNTCACALLAERKNLFAPVVSASISASRAKKNVVPHLARFQQVADGVFIARFPPLTLVAEHRAVKDVLQLFDLRVAEYVFFRRFARASVAVFDIGFK